jgi:sigma-B regulation protein RsbU (phosphoserine phosphatase)
LPIPVTTPGPSPPREPFWFVRTLPGRVFLLSSALLLILIVVRLFAALPEFVELFRKVVRVAWFLSLAAVVYLVVSRSSGRFLWRVRRKLILSYVFLGFVPVLLVVTLALVGSMILYINVAAYMFMEGFTDIAGDVQEIAETSASEIGRTPDAALQAITRKYLTSAQRYPGLSIVVLPITDLKQPPTIAGAWKHMQPPQQVPVWLRADLAGYRGTVAVPPADSATEWTLVIRSAEPTTDLSHLVIVDLPADADVAAAIEGRSRIKMRGVGVPERCAGGNGVDAASATVGGGAFNSAVAFTDCVDWTTGTRDRAAVGLDAPFRRVYANVAARSDAAGSNNTFNNTFFGLLVAIIVVFLVIQGAALFFGALLARSITYAVHELFVGTERVQQGDFTHRIRVDSGDQLGDLAGSFNRMSASIEHLLHVQREKQRLDDELRIARDIQKSLLPGSPPAIEGLTIADLCEPAREVGGDYYDFFALGPRQLGVMIADVSGKGTSAALYMAELKGLMLSLSQNERSPRRLLIEANRLLAAHLDNRSFITMTYLVVDLDARVVTCARAGHTPLIVVSRGCPEVVIPSGMVLGLRLPGASERFADLLEEHTRPLRAGDVYVLYTDGITEAMDESGDLFSDDALARVVASQHQLDAAGIRERVVRDVKRFVGDAEPHDDMTMIVLRVDDLGEASA